jgi:hypothetical protein
VRDLRGDDRDCRLVVGVEVHAKSNVPMPSTALDEDKQLLERSKPHIMRMLNALLIAHFALGAFVGGLLVVLAGVLWAQLLLVWIAVLVVYLAINDRARAEERRDELWREYLARAFKGERP